MELNKQDMELINRIKDHSTQIGSLVTELRVTVDIDQRWVSSAATDLQTGFMALICAVAQPTTF
jgi:hypothetical protein